MMDWWRRLAIRERGVLIGGSVVLVAILGYLLVIEPLATQRTQLQIQVAALRAELAWMRQASRELASLQATQQPTSNTRRSLLSLVDQTGRAAGLGEQLTRVEPEGTDRLRVSLENVEFDRLLIWLGQLRQQHGVAVVTAVISREDTNAQVAARLVLESLAP